MSRAAWGLLMVVPVVADLGGAATRCLDSIWAPRSAAGLDPLDEVLVIDNTRRGLAGEMNTMRWPGLRSYRDPDGHNLGVARSWNVGAREVLERGLDYLVICSSVMQFGPELHCTWRWQMEQHWGADVIECDGHSWHLIALHRRLFELVGLFDSNFYPAYEESIDWCYRLRVLDREGPWPVVWVNAMSQGAALHVDTVACPNEPLRRYYERKWGGPKGQERWTKPFGRRPLGFYEDVPIPELAARYDLGRRGQGWW